MTLLENQFIFSRHVALLFTEAWKQGFQFSMGEVWRAPEMQQIYFQQGKTRTMNSQHTKRLAIDLNLFRGGKLCTAEQIKPLGQFWESLDPLNRWGGSWRGQVESGKSKFVDAPHFERAV